MNGFAGLFAAGELRGDANTNVVVRPPHDSGFDFGNGEIGKLRIDRPSFGFEIWIGRHLVDRRVTPASSNQRVCSSCLSRLNCRRVLKLARIAVRVIANAMPIQTNTAIKTVPRLD
ncbi:MAG: hypothetical protein R3C05_11310 [Pirellulaceae bacterium]